MKKPISEQTWYAAFVGFVSIGIGLSLCRVAFAPVIPDLVDFHWMTRTQAGWSSSANYFGYAAGLLVIIKVSCHIDRRWLFRFALVAGTVSLLACAIDLGFIWLAAWRLVQGLVGTVMMVLVPGLVLKSVPINRQRIAGSITMAGAGGFTFAMSLLLPAAKSYGPTADWLIYGGICAVFSATIWPFFSVHAKGKGMDNVSMGRIARPNRRTYVLLWAGYLTLAIAAVPGYIYLSDYMHVALHASEVLSQKLYSLFGLGMFLGALIAGLLSQWLGNYYSILLLVILLLASNVVTLLSTNPELVAWGSFFFAFAGLGVVTIASLRTLELVGINAHPKFWARMCIAYALGQLVSSLVYAEILQMQIAYISIFWIAEFILVLTFVLFILAYVKEPTPENLEPIEVD